MRRTAGVVLAIVLACALVPLRLPAASCILSNGPSEKACKPHCCANMTCCKVSEKNKGPASHPLAQNDGANLQPIALAATFVAVSAADLDSARPLRADLVGAGAHAPPRLAATCIRLI